MSSSSSSSESSSRSLLLLLPPAVLLLLPSSSPSPSLGSSSSSSSAAPLSRAAPMSGSCTGSIHTERSNQGIRFLRAPSLGTSSRCLVPYLLDCCARRRSSSGTAGTARHHEQLPPLQHSHPAGACCCAARVVCQLHPAGWLAVYQAASGAAVWAVPEQAGWRWRRQRRWRRQVWRGSPSGRRRSLHHPVSQLFAAGEGLLGSAPRRFPRFWVHPPLRYLTARYSPACEA